MTYSFFRILWNAFLRIFLKIYFRLSISGKEHLPLEKSFIIVANHSSHLDAVCLAAGIPLKRIDQTYSVAAKDYFFSSFLRSFFFGDFH